MYSAKTVAIVAAASVLATAALIYLTPLKWVTIIQPTIRDIDAKTFQADFAANPENYIFIDVRPEAAYNALHAAGSINIPLHMLYDERRNLPKSGRQIVLICSGARASGVAYSYLQHYGFFNIARIKGGLENWVLEGLPTEGATAAPMSKVSVGKQQDRGGVCV